MFNVKKVIFELGLSLLYASSILITNLRPTRDSWTNRVSQSVIGNTLAENVNEVRSLGPRADEAHLSLDDINQLGDFIDAYLTNELTHSRNATIILGCPPWCFTFGVMVH